MNPETILLLINRQLKENARIYLIGLLVLFGLLSFMFVVIHQWRDSFAGAIQNGVFIIGLFISGGLLTNSMFSEFSHAPSRIWLLSLPAKPSEKVVASILISTLMFLVIYLIVFYMVDALYIANTVGLKSGSLLNPFKDEFYTFFFWCAIVNGLILLGRVVFNSYSLIKTILACIILFVALNYLNNLCLSFLIPGIDITSSILFDSFQFRHRGENVNVFLPPNIDFLYSLFTRFVMPVSIWCLVWLKFREKQV